MIELPSNLLSIRDRIVDCVQRGMPVPDDANELIKWFETDNWEDLMDAWSPEHIVLKLDYLSRYQFSDEELFASDYSIDQISDEKRISYARDIIERAFEVLDGSDCPSVHAIKIQKEDGASAVLGWLVEIHGQAGPVADYWGAFVDYEFFYQHLSQKSIVAALAGIDQSFLVADLHEEFGLLIFSDRILIAKRKAKGVPVSTQAVVADSS